MDENEFAPTVPDPEGSGLQPREMGPTFQPGATVARRFRIVRLLGRGAMGEVYAAEDLRLGLVVALKFLPQAVSRDPERIARLLDEIRIARQIAHPNVCRVYDLGDADGRAFLSMEHIEGEDLATLIRRQGRIAGDRAVAIARQIAAGLAAAHDHGVLHRDLKPSNVMVDRRGVVRLTDFGLAVAAGTVEGPRAREGTPGYMAPEQLAGREAGVPSDLYALGLVLYELFTGKPARKGQTLAELMTESTTAPSAPSGLAPDLDERVDRVVMRCLDPDPARRPASARAIAEALPGSDPLGPAIEAAQKRSDRIRAFREELAEATRAGAVLLDDAQWASLERYHAAVVRDLVERFDVDVSERGKFLSLGMRVLSTIGGLALAASVFYFLYSIWGSLGTGTQGAVLVGTVVAAIVATHVIAGRERRRYVTAMFACLSIGCFIAGTSIASAMMNAPVRPWHLLAWSAAALILAYAYRVMLALIVGLVLAVAVPPAFVLDGMGLAWANGIFTRPEGLMPAALLVGFAAKRLEGPAAGFAAAYRIVGLMLFFIPVVFCVNDPFFCALPWRGESILILYQVGGMACAAAAVALGVARRQRDVIYIGTTFFTIVLFSAMGHWWWDWMPRYAFFFVIGATALVILAILRRLHAAASRPPAGARS